MDDETKLIQTNYNILIDYVGLEKENRFENLIRMN